MHAKQLLFFLSNYRRPATKNFGTLSHDFGGVVSDTDDRIGAHILGVDKHGIACLRRPTRKPRLTGFARVVEWQTH